MDSINFKGINVSNTTLLNHKLSIYKLTEKDKAFVQYLNKNVDLKKLIPDISPDDYKIYDFFLKRSLYNAISEKKEGRLLFCDNKPCGVMAVSPREYTHNVDYVCTWPTEPNKKAPYGAQILFAQMFRNFLETSANIIELTATRFGNAITKYLALGFKPCGGDNYTEIMRITRERVSKSCENLDKKFQLVPSNDHRDLDLFTVLKNSTTLNS